MGSCRSVFVSLVGHYRHTYHCVSQTAKTDKVSIYLYNTILLVNL